MSKINDGGPAFPVASTAHNDYGLSGMSLRDYFAGRALGGLIATAGGDRGDRTIGGCATFEDVTAHFAKTAYQYADAMIAARQK